MKHLGQVKQGEYQGVWVEVEVNISDFWLVAGEVPPSSAIYEYARGLGIDGRRWGDAADGRVWIQGVKISSLAKTEVKP